MWTIELAVMAIMIVLNSVFAAYEIALASIGRSRLQSLAHANVRGAAAALRMRQNMEASLAVVQVGITLVGAVAAATGGSGASESIEPILRTAGMSDTGSRFTAIAIVVLPLIVVTIIFGELVPKVFALRNNEWVCLTISKPMEWFAYSVWPAVWLFETSVRLIVKWSERRWKPPGRHPGTAEEAAMQELKSVAALARTLRLIGHREEGIIMSAARMSNTPVRAIMLPAESIRMLHVNDSLQDALIAAHHEMHTRFPVTESPGDPEKVIGYVNFKDIVSRLRLAPDDPSLRGIVRTLPPVEETASVASCLEQLIRSHTHIALVRDRAGKVSGMVTMEDILEELVGEIHDEYDRLPSYIVPSGSGWIAGGSATLVQIRNITGIQLPGIGDKPTYTLNDWVAAHLGHPSQGGDEVRTDSIRVYVRKVRRQLVQEAQITQTEPLVNKSDQSAN